MNIPIRSKPFCVYTHTSPSGKVYVGITSNIKSRWSSNGHYYKTYNSIFKNAIEKYGWDNFKHEIILEDISKSEADYTEKYLIRWYKLHKMSYNITDGGEGKLGIHHSEETKRKISESNKISQKNVDRQKIIDGLRKYMASLTPEQKKERYGKGKFKRIGQRRSVETRAKLSAIAKGRDMSKAIKASLQKRIENSIPIIVTKDEQFIGEFRLISDICNQLCIESTSSKKSNIYRALKRGIRAFGYNFNYKKIEQ